MEFLEAPLKISSGYPKAPLHSAQIYLRFPIEVSRYSNGQAEDVPMGHSISPKSFLRIYCRSRMDKCLGASYGHPEGFLVRLNY